MGEMDVLAAKVCRIEDEHRELKRTTEEIREKVVSVATDGAVMKSHMENLTKAVEGLGKKFDKLLYGGIFAIILSRINEIIAMFK